MNYIIHTCEKENSTPWLRNVSGAEIIKLILADQLFVLISNGSWLYATNGESLSVRRYRQRIRDHFIESGDTGHRKANLLFESGDIDYRQEAFPVITRYNSLDINLTERLAIIAETKFT